MGEQTVAAGKSVALRSGCEGLRSVGYTDLPLAKYDAWYKT